MRAGVMCSRAEAIDVGVLVDVSEPARALGIEPPLALSRAVWDHCILASPSVDLRELTVKRRLFDVLFTCRLALLRSPDAEEIGVLGALTSGEAGEAMKVVGLLTLKVARSLGDDGGTVLTVTLLPED